MEVDMMNEVKDLIDKFFVDKAIEHKLNSGDIEPFRELELDVCVMRIQSIFDEWLKQNR